MARITDRDSSNMLAHPKRQRSTLQLFPGFCCCRHSIPVVGASLTGDIASLAVHSTLEADRTDSHTDFRIDHILEARTVLAVEMLAGRTALQDLHHSVAVPTGVTWDNSGVGPKAHCICFRCGRPS